MATDVYADELSALIWDKLVAIIGSEMNVGPGGPGTGANPNGRLQTCYMVHESIDMWSNLLPSIAVQLEEVDCSQSYSNIHDYARIVFTVAVATQANIDPTTGKIILDDAMKQLRVLIADGAGNGVGPVLRDKNNFNLGGLCAESHVERWHLEWQLPTVTNADARAFAFITYTARNKVLKLA